MLEPQKMNFVKTGCRIKKSSKAAIRDLMDYLRKKENLEKRYSKSDITFP